MDIYTATETAYKNGFNKCASVFGEIIKIVKDQKGAIGFVPDSSDEAIRIVLALGDGSDARSTLLPYETENFVSSLERFLLNDVD